MKWSGAGVPSILRTLARDGALYFMIIFTSHIIYTFTLLLGRVSDLVLNAPCCSCFRPVSDLSLGLQPVVQIIPAM
jgi:hypothetical protein